jgi:serine protease Do
MRGSGQRVTSIRTAFVSLVICATAVAPSSKMLAQTQVAGYAQADDAFMHMTLDQRVKLQVLLTAAGYWPAVPDADFSTRLFIAILRFQADNGFMPLGIVTKQQWDRLLTIAGPYLNSWRFELVAHPMTNTQIWVPSGLPLVEERTPTGLRFVNRPIGVVLTFDYFPEFNLLHSFEALQYKLKRERANIYYSKLYKDQFFVFSYSDGITDEYVRYHLSGRGGIGFSLNWNHGATGAHIERIATLISGSLWASTGGGPFTFPFTVKVGHEETSQAPQPNAEPQPQPYQTAPPQAEPRRPGSGTGIFVTNDGHLITNAHVVKDCFQIRVGLGSGNFEVGSLVAKDPTNDLALLKVNTKPSKVGHFALVLG